jgi:hypothetical protein
VNIYIDTETGPSTRTDIAAHIARKHLPEDAADTAKCAKAATAELAKTILGLFGELWVVSMAVDDGDPLTMTRVAATPTGEADLVQNVADHLGRQDLIRLHHLVAHNAPFDNDRLRHSAMRHGIRLPRAIAAQGLKPWDKSNPWFCTMQAWGSRNTSLNDICLDLGIPLLKGDIDGSKVWDYIMAGRIDEVAAYCADDVRRVRAVYMRIMGVS